MLQPFQGSMVTDKKLDELLKKCITRDLAAFEKLVRQYQPYAFALAMKLLCDETEAVDIVQESFVRVWTHIDRFDPRRKFTTWMYTIVTNLCLDKLRSIKRGRALFSSRDQDAGLDDVADEIDIAEIQSNEELAQIIKGLTKELSTKQRLVFTLRDLQDLTVEEVSHIVGISVGSVKTNLHFARKKIRKLMAEQYHVGRMEQ